MHLRKLKSKLSNKTLRDTSDKPSAEKESSLRRIKSKLRHRRPWAKNRKTDSNKSLGRELRDFTNSVKSRNVDCDSKEVSKNGDSDTTRRSPYFFSARSEMSILHTAYSEDSDRIPTNASPTSPTMTLQSIRTNRTRSLPIPFQFNLLLSKNFL